MLTVNVSIQGDKVIINGLRGFAGDINKTIQRGLTKTAIGINRFAVDFLNGAGGAGRKAQIVGPSGGFVKKSGEAVNFKPQFSGAGGYPVPVRTGNLKRLQDFVKPGENKGHIAADPFSVIVYNSAQYSRTIHEGTGSSEKFRPRRFLTDALEKFNATPGIAATLETEISTELTKRGLSDAQ